MWLFSRNLDILTQIKSKVYFDIFAKTKCNRSNLLAWSNSEDLLQRFCFAAKKTPLWCQKVQIVHHHSCQDNHEATSKDWKEKMVNLILCGSAKLWFYSKDTLLDKF